MRFENTTQAAIDRPKTCSQNMIMIKRRHFAVFLLTTAASLAQANSYTSPYAITLDADIATWTSDVTGRTQLVSDHSTPGQANWYNINDSSWSSIGHSWGPTVPQLYSTGSPTNTLNISERQVVNAGAIPAAPNGVNSTTYQQQRLLSVARSYIDTPYQHHHNPTWNPYANGFSSDSSDPNYWDWMNVSDQATLKTTDGTTVTNTWQATYGTGTAGIDCSNFASLIYNVGLGIQMKTDVTDLGEEDAHAIVNNPIIDAYGQYIDPAHINSPNVSTGNINQAGELDQVIGELLPGDLLFITEKPHDPAAITHVIIWLGIYGTLDDGSASGVPLVLSSHDNTPAIMDEDGNLPPPGVQILPFESDNWFYQNFSHATRIIDPSTATDDLWYNGPVNVPEPSAYATLGGLATALIIIVRRKRRD